MIPPAGSQHGIYVHLPWCRQRCSYCAMDLAIGTEPPWERVVDRLLWEASRYAGIFPGQARSLYLGGGSPSRMPARAIERLLPGLPLQAGAEITLELNPEDAEPSWLERIAAAGIRRISLGLQSLDAAQLARLGRAHDPRQGRVAAERVRELGLRSWSVDLMFGLPGQRVEDVQHQLRAFMDLEPPHVALYELSWEPHSALHAARQAGELHALCDELSRAQYELLRRGLYQAGLEAYELCSFARPGHQSEHNQGYWQDRAYLGLGPSAHSYAPDGSRWVNCADTTVWLQRAEPRQRREQPTPGESAVDLLLAGLRGQQGVLRSALKRRGMRLDPRVLSQLQTVGLIHCSERSIRLAEPGWTLADAITGRLARALQPLPAPRD